VTHLGRCVDKFELNLLQCVSTGLSSEGSSESDGSLLGSWARSFDDDEILSDLSVVRESSHRGDALLGDIKFGACAGSILLLSNAIHLLVEFGSVVESILTSSRNGEADSGRMPSSDTSNLSETLVRLSRKLTSTPTMSHSFKSVTLGNSKNIDHTVLLKDTIHWDVLLKQSIGEINLLFEGSSVNLDFRNVSLLLEAKFARLSVGDDTDDLSVLLQTIEFLLSLLLALSELLGVFGEGLLLRSVPVLVESSLEFLS